MTFPTDEILMQNVDCVHFSQNPNISEGSQDLKKIITPKK